MEESEKIRAILSRDRRFDGVFWYGVKTTGVVCRPSCPSKVPRVENIELFDTLRDALEAGYRPCKICMRKEKMKKVIKTKTYHSPCGEIVLGSLGDRLCLCDWEAEKHRELADKRLRRVLGAVLEEGTSPVIEQAEKELDEYFAGKRRKFTVPLLFAGTEFQKKVWNELLTIPCGETVSYGELARRIGRPTAVRAVANANGSNSISIFAPCHRVIGSDRSLTGYGGGLEAKKFLLGLEKAPGF